jgi:Protein of unknown function (DUF1194)
MRLRLCVVLAALVAALAVGSLPARAQTQVDLELVLAVDVSLSMDMDEQRLQRDGYVAAFRDPEIWNAIRAGGAGRIAVTYIEWAGQLTQQTILPWTMIDGPQAAMAFADQLEATPISRARMTSISGALIYSARELEQNPFKGTRRVVDVSGDGPNNSGVPAEVARDELVKKGIVINGLPIMLKRDQPSGFFDIRNLDQYYNNCVIGGTGAFMIPVRERDEFRSATRRKLILEISGLVPETPARIIPAQATSQPDSMDCMVGERMWRRYMDGQIFQ